MDMITSTEVYAALNLPRLVTLASVVFLFVPWAVKLISRPEYHTRMWLVIGIATIFSIAMVQSAIEMHHLLVENTMRHSTTFITQHSIETLDVLSRIGLLIGGMLHLHAYWLAAHQKTYIIQWAVLQIILFGWALHLVETGKLWPLI